MITTVRKFVSYARDVTRPYRRSRSKKELAKQQLADLDVQSRFEFIFDSNFWGNEESRSGNGSTLASTQMLRPELEALFKELNVTTFLDAPCGDWNWMRAVRFPPGMRYIGGDIVHKMTRQLQEKYGSDTVSFMHMNIIETPMPPAMLWMCRDCLFHLSFKDIFATLRNFLDSGIPYMLLTNMPETETNSDIITGGFRPLNLMIEPFALPQPRKILPDKPTNEGLRHMGLWHRDDITPLMKRNS